MSGSSASAGASARSRLRAAALAAALALLLPAGSFAQAPAGRQGMPLDLTPASRMPPGTQTGQDGPRQAPAPSLTGEPLPPPQSGSGKALPSAEPWRGLPGGMVGALAPALPEASPSPTVRALVRRLLSAPLAGEDGREAPETGRLRLSKLLSIGAMAEAEALAASDPGLLDDPGTARLWVERHLLAGDVEAACARKLPLPPETLVRLPVLCLASAGRTDEAALAAGLLREQGEGDPLLIALAEAPVAGEGVLPDHPGGPDPLHLAMMRIAGLPVPAEAAEQAAEAGLVDAAGLAELYRAAAPASGQGRAGLHAEAAGAGGIERERLVAQAAARLPAPMLAGTVGAAWADLLDGEGGGPSGTALPVEAQEAVVRLLLAQGRPSALPRLDRLAREDAAAAARLWPLRALGGGRLGEGARLDEAGIGLSAWLAAAVRQGGEGRAEAARVLALFDALGETVPGDAWLSVLDAGRREAPLPSPALFRRLRDATLAGSPGEVLLAALAALGDRAPASQPAAVLSPVLQGLRAAGFEAEARDLAREAALGPGF